MKKLVAIITVAVIIAGCSNGKDTTDWWESEAQPILDQIRGTAGKPVGEQCRIIRSIGLEALMLDNVPSEAVADWRTFAGVTYTAGRLCADGVARLDVDGLTAGTVAIDEATKMGVALLGSYGS